MQEMPVAVKKPRFFYGWVIASLCLLAEMASTWIWLYGLAVLMVPMSKELGWSRATLMGASSVATLIGGVASPLFGRFIDNHGARLAMTAAAIVSGIAIMLVSKASDLWVYYLLFGFVVGLTRPITMMLGVTAALANWFVKKRGRVSAIASTGVPLAGLLGVPLIQLVSVNMGWRAAWVVLGLTMFVLVAIPTGLFMRRRPEDMGLLPDGEARSEEEEKRRGESAPRKWWQAYRSPVDWEARDAVKTKAFWVLTLVIPAVSLGTASMAANVVAFSQDKGISPMAAAGAASSYTLGTLLARFFWGYLNERVHIQYCYVLLALIAFVSTWLVVASGNIFTAYLATLFFGLTGGGLQMRLQVWPDYFGRANIGAIRAWASPLDGFNLAVGPLFAAWVSDVSGSYNGAFAIFAFISLAAGVLVLFLGRPPQPAKVADAAVPALEQRPS